MSKKFLFVLISTLVVVSMLLTACGGAASVSESTVPTDLTALTAVGYGTIRVSAAQVGNMNMGNLMFVPNTAAIPANAIRVYSASSLAENGFIIAAGETMTAVGVATLIASLALGNTVQNVTEGRNLILRVENGDGTYGYWEVEPNGHIIVQEQAFPIQAGTTDASAVQEAAEGQVDVNARSQCQETGQNCQATPGPTKYAAVFGDANDSSTVAILNLWGFQGMLFLDDASLIASPTNYDLIIIRAGQPEGWRLASIPAIKARWPMAKIIVTSGGTYESKAKEMGADGFHASETGPETLKSLLQSIGVIP